MTRMSFVKVASDLLYMHALCDVLEQASAEKSYENILRAIAISRPWRE